MWLTELDEQTSPTFTSFSKSVYFHVALSVTVFSGYHYKHSFLFLSVCVSLSLVVPAKLQGRQDSSGVDKIKTILVLSVFFLSVIVETV